MKKTKLFLLLTFFSLAAVAQQDFQGTVRYKVTRLTGVDEGEDSTMIVTMHLAPNRILFITDKEDEENVLIMLDSLKIFMLDKENKTYSIKRIYKVPQVSSNPNETIAGYKTTLLQTQGSAGFGTGLIQSQLWTADDLIYRLPPGVYINEFMMFFQNDRIALKVLLHVGGYDFDEETEEEIEGHFTRNYMAKLELKAFEVKPGIMPSDLFELPKEFSKENTHYRNGFGNEAIDTMVIEAVDTAAMIAEPPPPPPPPKKPAKTPVKTNTKTSSPARKDD